MLFGCMEVVDEYIMRPHKTLIKLMKLIDMLEMQNFNVQSGVGSRDILA